ncbi:MAG TPA: protein-disulfide reductase DsbD domain-containing protein, partial [Legionellaceae bacterium]|nr:protein-disulfide reductase DsbD domain-containing protein [Legionellaceae bacterium]
MRIKLTVFLLLCTVLSVANPLPQEEAFHLIPSIVDANTLHLHWTLKPGYFLYQQRIRIENNNDTYLNIGDIHYPQPQVKLSPKGAEVLIYRDALNLNVPVLAHLGGEFLIQIHYQGCSDEGYCYPPQIQTIKLSFNKEHMLHQITIETDLKEEEPSLPTLSSQNAKVQSLFANAHPVWIIISFFGFGLLLAFTPC